MNFNMSTTIAISTNKILLVINHSYLNLHFKLYTFYMVQLVIIKNLTLFYHKLLVIKDENESLKQDLIKI